jgi:predicted PP-loop superfamily ATPase
MGVEMRRVGPKVVYGYTIRMDVSPNPTPMTAVAMSGGVDSSAVAAILKERGFPVVGLTMQLWNQRRLPIVPGPEASAAARSTMFMMPSA